jgi:hypothetical protein
VDAISSYLKVTTNGASIWSCPNRKTLPYFDPGNNQYLIGYSYMGGMTTWANAPNNTPYSPVKLALAKPWWTLAADGNLKVNGVWAGTLATPGSATYNEYASIPPHPGGGGSPAGGDEVFADGSAKWCQFNTMYRFNNYAGALGTTQIYWFQDSSDFSPALLASLNSLR